MSLGPRRQHLQGLGLEDADGRSGEGPTVAGRHQSQPVLAPDQALSPAVRRTLQPARLAKDLEHSAGRQQRDLGQPAHRLANPLRPLHGEGDGVLEAARRGGGGDHLAPGGVEPQADPARPSIHPQAHGNAGDLEGVAGRITLGQEPHGAPS